MTVDKSSFAVFRVVAACIARDGKVHWREKQWFEWLLRKYGVTPEQRLQLKADLKNPPRLEYIYTDIKGIDDRLRVRELLKKAINRDGQITLGEQNFYNEVIALDKRLQTETSGDVQLRVQLSDEIADVNAHTEFWKDIKAFSEHWGRRLSPRELAIWMYSYWPF